MMITVPEEPPAKRRRKQKTKNAVPKWETTRLFQETHPTKLALPTITEDGDVRRHASSNPNFVFRAKTEKRSSIAKVSAVQPLTAEHDRDIAIPSNTNETREPTNRSFKVTRKRQRRELENYAEKIDNFEATKANIGTMATKILANPEERVALFKQLRQMAQHHKGKSAALVVLTEAQLYKDVAPAYKIRSITEKEAESKVSKEVARVRNFEEAFLASYQRFAKACISITRWRSGGANETAATQSMKTVRLASCKALGELISALPHFNDANLLASAVCALVVDRDEDVRKHSSNALRALLQRAHRASGQTLELCVFIAKTLADLAAGQQKAAPEAILIPLVSIQFANFPLLPTSTKKKNQSQKSKRFIKKRRRKQKEETAMEETELEKDLREADAETTPHELFTAKKGLLDAACHAYFNIIKAATGGIIGPDLKTDGKRVRKPPPALSAALKGLMRVATFVSIDVLEDILGALTSLIAVGCLPLGTRFRCLSAAYAILAKNSSTARLDPDSFTGDVRALDSTLYASLGRLYGLDTPSKDEEYITFDVAETIITAQSRREIPAARCTALARRLSILSASAAPTHACTIGLLLAAQQLIPTTLVSPIYAQNGKGYEEFGGGDLGTVQRLDLYTDDPDIANAQRTASWELSCLASHFHPTARDIAQQIASGNCGSHLHNTKETIVLRAKNHKSAEGGFNPAPIASLTMQKHAKLARKTGLLQDGVLGKALPMTSDREGFLSDRSDQRAESISAKAMKVTNRMLK